MSLPPERRSPAKIILGALFNNIDVNEIPAAFGFLSIILLTVFTITAFPNMSFGGSPVGSDPKSLIIRQLQEEASLNNARQLITKMNDHCFDKCVPTPGSSLSKKEQGCLSACMEKYMATWNAVSKAYIARAQQGVPQAMSAGAGDSSWLSTDE